MEVTKISATLRHSKEMGGSWKSLEVGAEASIDPREDWMKATAHLYADLAKQFKALWSANGATAHQDGHQINGERSEVQGNPNGSQQHPEHFCQEHDVPFKARTGQYGEFFSHQIKGTRQWCNEAKR